MARSNTTTATVMTDEPMVTVKKTKTVTKKKVTPAKTMPAMAAKADMASGTMKTSVMTAPSTVVLHPDHHINVMYMIMTSFLIALMVGGLVWFALDMRIESLEQTVQMHQTVLNNGL